MARTSRITPDFATRTTTGERWGSSCHTPMVDCGHDPSPGSRLENCPRPADPVGLRLRGRRAPAGRRHEVSGPSILGPGIGSPVGSCRPCRCSGGHRPRHVGADVAASATTSRFRSGPAHRSLRRPRTWCAVPPIARARVASGSDRSIAPRSSGRTAVSGARHATPASGSGRRRRGHHWLHSASRGARPHRLGLG